MLAEETTVSVSMDFFSLLPGDGDGSDDIPSMPCFECSNAEDRPMAPEAEEYPLGCEVELRDKDFAKMAQEEAHWEPLLDEVFAVPRRRVTVCRHHGDYTFVLCNDVTGYDLVGFTLYRACLSEPKVKTTKYYADVAAREDDEDIAGQIMREARRNDCEEQGGFSLEDAFNRPVKLDSGFVSVPWMTSRTSAGGLGVSPPLTGGVTVGKPGAYAEEGSSQQQQVNFFDTADALPLVSSATGGGSGGGALGGSSSNSNTNTNAASPIRRWTAVDGMVGGGAASSEGNSSNNNTNVNGQQRMTSNNVGQVRRRNKFATFMKKGTDAIAQRRYDRAVECYNLALQEAPEEEARALSSRSVAYLMQGQTDLALQDAKRVIQLTPDHFLGYLRTANVLRGMRQFNDAQVFYKEALKRDKTNAAIRKLLLGNSVAMLYDARTKRFPKLKMIFDEDHTRVLAVARQSVNKDETVLRETTPIAALYSCHNSKVLVDGTVRAALCNNCGRPFLDEDHFCRTIPGMRPDIFRMLYNEPKPVRCNYDCNSMYCSDECRSKAWAFHHWVECGERGRWRRGVNSTHALLDEFIVNATKPEEKGPTGQQTRRPPSSLAEDLSPAAIASTIRVAVRMFSRMLSCVWSLRDAVHMYDWVKIAPAVEAQLEQARDVLRSTYDLLSSDFLNEEKSKLTYNLFERCYLRAKSNCVTLTVSSWGKVAIRAESLLNFVDGDPPRAASSDQPGTGRPSTGAHAHAHAHVHVHHHTRTLPADEASYPSSSAIASSSLTDEQRTALQHIVDAPPQGISGTYFSIVALFEGYAATAATNMNYVRQPRPPGPHTGRPSSGKERAEAMAVTQQLCPSPNVEVQSMLETYVCIHVRASRPIKRGETLVASVTPYQPNIISFPDVAPEPR